MKALALLLLLPLLAGCLGEAPAAADAAVVDAPSASCERVTSGHLLWVEVDGFYVAPHADEPRVAYRESNGIHGLQTEGSCPANPDTKIA